MPRRTRKSRNLTRPEPCAARTAADKVAAARARAARGVGTGISGRGEGGPRISDRMLFFRAGGRVHGSGKRSPT